MKFASIQLLSFTFALCLTSVLTQAQDDSTPPPKAPRVEPASSEGQDAIKQFKYPGGFQCELFAAEPMAANIVAFHRDFQGRFFLCETFRQGKGVEDNRKHRHWMDDELQAQKVADRVAYIKKHIPDYATRYTENDDRIRLLIDSNGDGKADVAKVFSDRYNAVEMGTGAGVLSYRGNVYYTNIPSLFLLNDKNNDGVADSRVELSTGYGVRFAFRGHDMHGLIVGPDGRLYFSIGDRGYNVSPQIKDPTSGAVFRCELDGSNLEVVATGLRNPQELAFDDYGNLFTGDNNSDSGDKARFTEIVYGGDSGWRMHYQYISDRGPFNREKIWHPYNEDTPAYILPPITNISDGPSGLEYYPGTGFGEQFAGRFFLCDFRGDASRSGIRSFQLSPKGASWDLVNDEQPFWNILATDLDFGSDGKLYVSDWVLGWNGLNKGRIYSFFDPQKSESKIVKEVESILRSGMKEREVPELVQLLEHADRRVRQESQFELVARKQTQPLLAVAQNKSSTTLARIHALWGLEQLARTTPGSVTLLQSQKIAMQLADQDSQVVIATLKFLASHPPKDTSGIVRSLQHENRRVRFAAAMALQRGGKPQDATAIAKMLIENRDEDPTLRHGGIMGLVGIFERESAPQFGEVAKLAQHESASVRLAVCVAMRKVIESNRLNTYAAKTAAGPIVAQLLASKEEHIVLEAARVIHDLRVRPQMPALAGLIRNADQYLSDALVRRILNANFRVGSQATARALAKYAANPNANSKRRIEVIQWMPNWKNPPARDHLLHDWAPLTPKTRNLYDARDAMESVFNQLMESNDAIAEASILAAGKLQITSIKSGLDKMVLSTSAKSSSRVAALRSLARLDNSNVPDLIEQLMDPESGQVLSGDLKVAVFEVSAKKGIQSHADTLMRDLLKTGTLPQKQVVIAQMGTMKDPASGKLLSNLLMQLTNDELEAGLRLDVVNACKRRKSAKLKQSIGDYLAKTNAAASMTNRYFDSLEGGDRQRGQAVFFEKTEANCVRCHKISGRGGAVGPDLSGVAKERDRRYLLEAIVEPNKTIAKGFAQTKVLLDDGRVLVGLAVRENDDIMVLMDADGKETEIEQASIEDTMIGDSSMPTDLHQKLSPYEIRDLVEYLSSCKTPAENSGHEE